ncbi:MAG: ankyrin repeat domain-containing protein [Verrucomicrobiota bacterium]
MDKFVKVFLALAVAMIASAGASLPKYSSIDEAIARGDVADVKAHVAAFPERAVKGKHPKLTPLNQSILRKQTEIALVLIASGADVNATDPSKRTPLHLCVERNLPKVAEALLEAKAKPDELDKGGWTPLHNAAAKDRLEMATVLVKGGASLAALSERGGSPLHEAAASGGLELVQLFLDNGVDLSIKAADGSTALDVAKRYENSAAIKLLSK